MKKETINMSKKHKIAVEWTRYKVAVSWTEVGVVEVRG